MAYGAKGKRNGLHTENKSCHTIWLSDDEWSQIRVVARRHNTDYTGLVRKIADGSVITAGRYHVTIDGCKLVNANGRDVTQDVLGDV